MVPLSRPYGPLQSHREILELYEAHLHTTRSTDHAIGIRSLESPIGSACALYIFLGFLISLCIAAPVIAHFRKKRGKYIADCVERAKRAVAEVDGRVAEINSLQRRQDSLLQEQERYQTSQQVHEDQLRDERLRFHASQQQIHDLVQTMRNREQALTVAQRERDTALEEAREARQRHATTL